MDTQATDDAARREWEIKRAQLMAERHIAHCEAHSLVVTIETVPLKPLAMRHYEIQAHVREER